MKELTLTQKVLIGVGAIAVTAAAAVGTVVLIKKYGKKQQTVIEFNEEDVDTIQEADEEITGETVE